MLVFALIKGHFHLPGSLYPGRAQLIRGARHRSGSAVSFWRIPRTAWRRAEHSASASPLRWARRATSAQVLPVSSGTGQGSSRADGTGGRMYS